MSPRQVFNPGRRRFLKGAGGAVLALPFLPSLVTRAEAAQGIKYPRRFIAIFSANGQHDSYWYPTQQLPWVETGKNIREMALTDIPGPISTVIGPQFDRFRKKAVLIRGLDCPVMYENTHIATKMMSGFGQARPLMSPTIDQVMARSAAVYEREPWMRSLNVVADGQSEMKYLPLSAVRDGDKVTPVVPFDDPAAVFQKIFPTPINHDVKTSIIDDVSTEMKALLGNQRLSKDDRQRLDSHLSFLREIEKQVSPSNACVRPELDRIAEKNEQSAAVVLRNYARLITSSLHCDLCRVFGFQLAHTQEQRSFAWLTGVTATNHHNLTHDHTMVAPLAAINQWYASIVAQFLEQLDVVEDTETGATYLDNSIVFWGNESGVYNLAKGSPHYNNDMQVMLFGSGGGIIKTNRFINYQKTGQKVIMWEDGTQDISGPDIGRPYNQLLITLMRKMGLSHEEWEHGTEPGFGDYRVNFKGQYDFGDRRSGLPNV